MPNAPPLSAERGKSVEKKELYLWQKDCLNRWLSHRGRGMVQAATGTGKTLLALSAVDRLEQILDKELHIKIVVPSGALLRQWRLAVKNHLSASAAPAQERLSGGADSAVGLRGGGFFTPDNRKYMIYVVNSARYELAREILSEFRNGNAVFLIADECHHYTSGQNRLIFEFYPHIDPDRDSFFALGLSATLPSGPPLEYLTTVLGQKIYDYGIREAVRNRNIASYDVFHVSVPFQSGEEGEYQDLTERMRALRRFLLKARPDLKEARQTSFFERMKELTKDSDPKVAKAAVLYLGLSYKRRSRVCLAEERLHCADALVDRLPGDQRILIFGERIQQAEALYALLRDKYPGQIGRYHSQMGTQANRNALDRFRSGELRILITCKALDEGFDVPDASAGIILSGTSRQRQRIQRIGRLLRKNARKERVSLYYLHVADSVEETWFLPDSGAGRIFDLDYVPSSASFRNAPYEAASSRIFASLYEKKAPPAVLRELERCLRLGIVRSDWQLDDRILDEKIQNAAGLQDKNYWICMKRLKGFSRDPVLPASQTPSDA